MSGFEGNDSPRTPRNPALERVLAMNVDGGSERQSQAGSSAKAKSAQGSVKGKSAQGSAQGSQGFGPGLGHDPARDPGSGPTEETRLVGRRVDLPPEAFQAKLDTPFTRRPGYNTEGKPITLELNIFPVIDWPKTDIHQYDVSVSPNPLGRDLLIKKVWNSTAVQDAISVTSGRWLYDGRKLAWSSQSIPRREMRVAVDLDKEAGKAPRPGRTSVYYLQIRESTQIRLQYVHAYLQGKVEWDKHILEGLNFLDHAMRQFPSESLLSIKRNFYSYQADSKPVDRFLEVIKGTYSAVRLSETVKSGGSGLGINVDVSNTVFWTGFHIANVLRNLVASLKNEYLSVDVAGLHGPLRPVIQTDQQGRQSLVMSEAFRAARKMAKMKFQVKHRGKPGESMTDPKVYTIKNIMFNPAYGKDGATSFNVKFMKNYKDGRVQEVSVYQHFQEQYGIRLEFPMLPIIETTRGAFFPMEVCNLISHQRYPYKLDPSQTQKMIKIAVTRPNQRRSDILAGVSNLKWDQDPYLNDYGVRVQPQMITTKARLLQNPKITYANTTEDPKMSGRWDLRGKQFIEPNPQELKSWAFVACGERTVHKPDLENFASQFTRVYRSHGGRVTKPAMIFQFQYAIGYEKMVTDAYMNTGNANKQTPQIIFFVVESKNSIVYERIKKNMDCRYCVVSQVLLADHVRKAQQQYCSNVAMKVNSKLGGATCRITLPNAPATPPFFKRPTMIVGLDVSHASPGSSQPSMAAMTVSMDKFATRYAGSCETNGWRVEIVNAVTMHYLFPRLLAEWQKINRCSPQHVYFFRDGVSEGQFMQVIQEEVKELKRMFKEADQATPKVTVVVATKRHHVRFFPKPGDRSAADKNSNPLPGTLVERDATHPYHFDFFLCSHVAIQGTARPVHYHVIYDDADVKPNDLQRMIYHQCYQYCRSTTPVSLHPSIYYAHLASNRARAHENIASSRKEMLAPSKPGFPIAKKDSDVYTGQPEMEAPKLLPMSSRDAKPESIRHINTTMWYV